MHLWQGAARVAVLLPLAALVFAVTVLAIKARPAIVVNGWGFLTRSGFDLGQSYATTVNHIHGVAVPVGASYGAGALIAGTLESSFIAVIIALPISIGAAFALTERMPRWVSQPLGFFIELLAGVPSVLFGLWGILDARAVPGRRTSIRRSPTTCLTCRSWTSSKGPPGTVRGCSRRVSCSPS